MATKKVAKKAAAKKPAAKKTKKPAQKEQAQKVETAAPKKPLPVGKGPLGFTTSNVFKESISKVWDAAVLSKHLKKHFIDDMKGEYSAKLTPVSWYWKELGWWDAKVTKFTKHKEVEFQIPSMDGKYLVTVRFEFVKRETDGMTIFRIHESGYPTKHLKNAFMMCEGWTEFHCGVKAYLKWGGNLNKP